MRTSLVDRLSIAILGSDRSESPDFCGKVWVGDDACSHANVHASAQETLAGPEQSLCHNVGMVGSVWTLQRVDNEKFVDSG